MKVALYARVSTKDKEQTVETQLHHLREYTERRGWEAPYIFTDEASATNMRERTGWRDLLAQARKGGIDAVVVTKLDRAFRSAKDTYDNLAYLDSFKVGFISTTQPFDTTTATGKLQLGILAAVAEFEKALISERTKDGLARVKAEGKRLGRPPGSKDGKKRKKAGYYVRWSGARE